MNNVNNPFLEGSGAAGLPAIQRNLVDEWFDFLDVSPSTLQTYQKSMKVFLAFLNENGITRPTRKDLVRFRDEQKKSFSPSTVQVRMSAVRMFFQFLEEMHLYPNVAARIKGAKIDSKSHRKGYLTSGQCRELLSSISQESIAGRRDYALIALMVTTGLRTVSIMRANIEDLRTLGDQSVLYYQSKGKEDKADFVLIPPQVESALRRMLKDRKNRKGSEPLFISLSNRSNGQRLQVISIREIIKNYYRQIGLSESLSAHSLRHAAGSIAVSANVDLMDVQQMLGHQNITTTMIYVNSYNHLKSKSEKAIASAIFDDQVN